ncbi:MAG: hypothetical protein VB858_12475 [Planctomycetaceae bacterium]
MKAYRFWAKAAEPVQSADHPWNVECYGGSDISVEEALERAAERARAAAVAISEGHESQLYAYGERPLREEIVREIELDGDIAAIITRNSYGALILNTANVAFADIDYPAQQHSGGHADGQPQGCLAALFGLLTGSAGQADQVSPADRADQDEVIVDRVRQLVEQSDGLGVRLYRTSNGFRALVTSQTWDPLSPDTTRLLEDFGSDPLYVTLCRSQQCFRARLTPKPYRCEMENPPVRFPWPDDAAEQAFRRWEQKYEQATQGYSACVFIGAFGHSDVDPVAESIVRLHDGIACAEDGPIA